MLVISSGGFYMKIPDERTLLKLILGFLILVFCILLYLIFCDSQSKSNQQTTDQTNYKAMVTGVAIVLSALIASFIACLTIINHKDTERRKWTLEILQQGYFTLAWMRDIQQNLEEFMDEFTEVFSKIDKSGKEKTEKEKDFHKEIEDRRKLYSYVNVIKTLDNYQQLAVGIDKEAFDRDMAKALCKTKLLFLHKKASPYIKCLDEFDSTSLTSGNV